MHVARAASRLSPMRTRVGACVTKNGKVLGLGFNKPGYSSRSKSMFSRHAEVAAIISAGDCRGATMFVFRGHGLTGAPMLARPCKDCAEAIEMAGIRRVIFSE